MSTPVIPADAGPTPGAFARVVRMLWAPEDVFAAIVRRPSLAAAGLALLALIASTVATQVIVLARVDTEAVIREAFTNGPFTGGRDVKEEDIEQAVKMAQSFAFAGPAIAVVTVPIMFSLLAAFLFLGLKLAGSGSDYLAVFEAVTLGFWPPTLAKAFVFVIVGLSASELDAQAPDAAVLSSLAAFAPSAPAALRAFLGAFDVFTIWTILLLVIGLATVGRVKTARAAAVVLGLFAFWTILKVGGAFAMSALQGMAG